MKVLGIIPARYASTRFPGKPLAVIGDKPMIQHVFERVSEIHAVDEVVVATDDDRIFNKVVEFGGKAVMTNTSHKSGTDRCGEVLGKITAEGRCFDVVVNIQGDEPFVEHTQIEKLIGCFTDPNVQIATLRKRIISQAELESPNVVKLVCDRNDNALYFSRFSIPFQRGKEIGSWMDSHNYFKHIGVYAYRTEVLREIVKLQQTPLECSESLEQLRWLENGLKIKVAETDHENIAIDTPDDLLKLKNL